MEKKPRVRDGDPVCVFSAGRWLRSFVAEATDKGVWILDSHRAGVQHYRCQHADRQGIAHFYPLDSHLWRRDTHYWGRQEDERRERRLEGERKMQIGHRFDFLRRKRRVRKEPKVPKIPRYEQEYRKPPVYIPPPNYAISHKVSVASSSAAASVIPTRSTPKQKKQPENPEPKEAPELDEKELQQREQQLDAEYRARTEAATARRLQRNQAATEELARMFEMADAERQRKIAEAYAAGLARARRQRERLLTPEQRAALARRLKRSEAARRGHAEGLLSLRERGFADELTVLRANETAVVFDQVSGTATVLHGPASVRLTLNEHILSEEQAALVLEILAEDEASSLDLSNLSLPTGCEAVDVARLPVRELPEWAEQLPATMTPISQDDLVQDLREASSVRTEQPCIDVVGLDLADIDRQLRNLDSLAEAGFICEEEHAKRRAALLELRGSGWCLPQNSVAPVARPQRVAAPAPLFKAETTSSSTATAALPLNPPPSSSSSSSTPSSSSSTSPIACTCEEPQQTTSMQPMVPTLVAALLPIGATEDDVRCELARLETLRESGFIQESEYTTRRQALLALHC